MNIAKLNTASLDDKTFIIKRGTSGGSSTPDTPSGGGDWHYFDVSGLEGMKKLQSLQVAMTHKVQGESITGVFPVGFGYGAALGVEDIKAIGTDYSMELRVGEQSATIGQSITTAPWYGQAPEITKEQFYDLNA